MPLLQNIIAILYDCDLTLTPEYMQEPLFRKYGVNGDEFWKESTRSGELAAQKSTILDTEMAYMNLILRYVRKGKFPNLSNKELQALGVEIPLYPGLPEFFQRISTTIAEDPKYRPHDITVEHYIISTGLKVMVEGSKLGSCVNGIFASEFLENEDGVIAEVARAIGFAKKTEFIHLINKGGNVDPTIDVNGVMPDEYRRIPFESMIYIGDGPTDVPCFATLNRRGGTSVAVYNPASAKSRRQAYQLRLDDRVFEIGPADYSEGSHISWLLEETIRGIANRIIEDREKEIRKRIKPGPQL